MFQRPKKKRTKASSFPADGSQTFVLEQICEESLGEIFSFFWPTTLSLHKTVNGSPVNTAEFFPRFLRRWRFTLRLQHHAPVRGRERGPAILPARTNLRRRRTLIQCRAHTAIQVTARAKSKPACSDGCHLRRGYSERWRSQHSLISCHPAGPA